MATRRKRLALVAAIMGSFVAGLDATAVNVALPAIRADLGGGLAGQQWVSNAYLLALGSVILVGGSLGDVFGERRVFSIGVAGFGAVSLLCAIAPSIELLILPCPARRIRRTTDAKRAGGHRRSLPVGRTGCRNRFLDRMGRSRDRGWAPRGRPSRGRGFVALDLRGEHPFVIATLMLVSRAVPARVSGPRHARVDWLGAGLAFSGLAGPVVALIGQPAVGWSSPQVWGTAIGAAGLLPTFVIRESRTPVPMLPLGLFRRRNFAVGNIRHSRCTGGSASPSSCSCCSCKRSRATAHFKPASR
jgi:MFS family permease